MNRVKRFFRFIKMTYRYWRAPSRVRPTGTVRYSSFQDVNEGEAIVVPQIPLPSWLERNRIYSLCVDEFGSIYLSDSDIGSYRSMVGTDAVKEGCMMVGTVSHDVHTK